MKQFNILGRITKIPGGLVLCGMLAISIINTFFPQALQIGYSTTGAFTSTGTMTLIGMALLISGSQVRGRQLGTSIVHGGFFLLLRSVTGIIASYFLHKFFGLDGFLGIPTVALVICLSSLNPGVYMACMQSFGDDVDKAAFGTMNLWGTPVIPLILINLSMGGAFDWRIVVSTFVPFLLGFILASLDPAFSRFFGAANPVVLFFLGMTFGSNINLINVFKGGLSGLLLMIIFLVVNLLISVPLDKLILRGRGYAGAATCAVGGTAIAAAGVIANAMPQYAPYAALATGQVALASVITGFITPFIAGFVAKKYGCPVFDKEKEMATAQQ